MVFDPKAADHATLERTLHQYLHRLDTIVLPDPRTVEIPVCYGGDFGPDLMELAAMHSIPPDRVVQIHSAASYLVYFIGFVPGFAYLGGLPAELATPRLQTPRKRVPRGSVAIGGTHTGVYPFETPGGWRLIGRTPLEIFDPRSAELSRLRIGDIVRFQPIDEDQFNALRCQ
jgi:inhibitor of KinA